MSFKEFQEKADQKKSEGRITVNDLKKIVGDEFLYIPYDGNDEDGYVYVHFRDGVHSLDCNLERQGQIIYEDGYALKLDRKSFQSLNEEIEREEAILKLKKELLKTQELRMILNHEGI